MKLRIVQDEDAQSPTEFDDTVFLISEHKDFCVPSAEQTKAMRQQGRRWNVDVAAEIEHRKKTHHVFLLEAYIHSGVVLALAREGNFPDRQWDVSLCGAVFVDKSETKSKDKARDMARGKIDEWNQYLSGDVWGYIVEDENGNHIDSCWGFYGREHAEHESAAALKNAEENSFDPVI